MWCCKSCPSGLLCWWRTGALLTSMSRTLSWPVALMCPWDRVSSITDSMTWNMARQSTCWPVWSSVIIFGTVGSMVMAQHAEGTVTVVTTLVMLTRGKV